MSETLIPAYYNTKINNHDWVIYMGGEKYFPAYPIKHTEPEPEYPNYLTFEALEDGEIGWWTHPDSDVEVHIFWSKDKESWTEFTQNDDTADYISVSSGENLYCRGINLDGVSGQYALDSDNCNGFVQNSGKWNIKGNIMSLIDYDNMATMTEMVGNFYYLFSDEDGFKRGKTIDIVNAVDLVLPATTLASWCYYAMFKGCTNLTSAPSILPATTLAEDCYYAMFEDCRSLTAAPELPATTLANDCYNGMFLGCSSLTTAPELPATTLAGYCYGAMFQGCSSLITAPELPATTLADSCYSYMFYGCSGLTTAPELPATTLANDCYSSMFRGCTNLTTAPELPATTLAAYCYRGMFRNCSKLNYIKCLGVNGINQNNSTTNWVYGVASGGTFIKNQDATWTTGVDGIPTNWIVEDA